MKLHRLLCKSGVHRLACLSLYRALLTQCGRIPVPTEQKEALKYFVGKQFIKNRKHDSARLARVALEKGYEALSTLNASAAGDQTKTSQILHLVQTLPPPRPAKPKSPPKLQSQSQPQPNPPPSSSPGRPDLMLPHLPRLTLPPNSRRRIPTLMSANRLPLLRLHETQPPILSAILTKKIKRKQAAVNREARLAEEIWMGEMEDHWDRDVGQLMRVEGVRLPPGLEKKMEEPSWVEEAVLARMHVQGLWERWTEEGLVRGRRLWEIVKAEKELKAKEDAEREGKERERVEKRTGERRYRVREGGLEKVDPLKDSSATLASHPEMATPKPKNTKEEESKERKMEGRKTEQRNYKFRRVGGFRISWKQTKPPQEKIAVDSERSTTLSRD